MDYDDNDFQSQNLPLAGEGSTKFPPPVLRPYALPKFDFDESLQANLRFDSLVETEVFLGIESNDDNQWIDAFSRGGSGIEFSSTAAESCSISRHGNVWSEATSSESVEMLLKSVGQEEYIPRQTVIQESDACDELACLAKQMDRNPKPDYKNEFKDNVTDLQSPGGTHANFSGLKEDMGTEQSQAGASHGHEGEFSIDGSSGNLEPNDICRNINLPVSERSLSLLTGDGSNNTNQKEVETVADDLHHGETQDNSTASVVRNNITESSLQNTADGQQGTSQTQTNNQDLESSMKNKEAVIDTRMLDGNTIGGDALHADKSLCSIPTEGTLEGENVVGGLKTGFSSVEVSLKMDSIDVSELQKEEKCSKDICVSNPLQVSASEDAILLKDGVVNDQYVPSAHESPEVSVKDDSMSEGQVVEVSNSSCEACPNIQQNVDVVDKTYCCSGVTNENELLKTGDRKDTETLSSKSEACVFAGEENNISTVNEGNCESRAGSFSSFSVAACSTKSSILDESAQTCVNNEPDRQSDHEKFNQDASVNDQESKKISSDSGPMHCDVDESHLVDKGVVSSSLSAGSLETKLTTSTVSIDVIPVNNSERNNSTTCEKIDMPPPSSKIVSSHGFTGHSDFQGINIVGSSSAEEKEAGISTLVGSSEQETAPCAVTGSEIQRSSDTGVAGKIGESPAATNDMVGQESTKAIDMPPVISESSVKQSDSVIVSIIKDDKETVQKNHDKSSSKKLGNILFGNKGSISSAPLPDSCGELHETGSVPANSTCSPSSTFGSPPQTERHENQVEGSVNRKPPVSEFISSGAKNTSSTTQDLEGPNATEVDKSSTPDVNSVFDLSKKDIAVVSTEDVGKKQSIPVAATNQASVIVDGSPSTSMLGTSKTKTSGNVSHDNPQILDGEVAPCSASKATPERKTRQSSNKTAGKESSRRGSRAKVTTPARQSGRGEKSTKVSLTPPPGFQLMQSNEVQQYAHIDSNNTKPFAFVNTSTSSLPDLNSSASPPVLFHQPFTDLQQVQLRAQIFVYGALIQGIAPDEAYMISAFGGTDGGKSTWENAWRASMERQLVQKSHPVNPETPLQSRSVARTSDLAVKQSTVQGKGSVGRSSSKATSTIVSPLIPLSSPLWSLPSLSCDSMQSSALARGSVVDYPQALNPLHPYQTPPMRNFLGHNTSWMSQAPLRGPWVASPASAPDNITNVSASPVSDTIKIGPVKGSSFPPSSGVKNVIPGPPASSAGLQSIFVGTASLLDANNVTVLPAQRSSDPKPKKRKKVVVTEDLDQKALQSLTPAVSSHTSTSVAVVPLVGSVPITSVEKSVVSVSPFADQPKHDQSVEKRIMSDESLMKVKEARVHAEEASALSAAAVNHSIELWNQLDKHKGSGLMPDIEAKLASAAVAVAAAAAVAKAAAAAANVASNAAFQAKLMADEALISSGYENSSQSNKISLSEGTSNLGKATPSSILKGTNGTDSPGSIIVAAKEAVRRRVEAASAATKRAENMDAIVKAAELAAEAVSQAGKIVTMGDPLPLSNIIEAGPEGCWKSARDPSQQVGLLKEMTRDVVNIDEIRDIPENSHMHNREILSGGISASVETYEKNSRGRKGPKVSGIVKHVLGSEPEIQAPFTITDGSENLEEYNIKEGSLVEVFKDEEGYKAAWFTANILSLKEGKAYVCYTSLVAVEGAGPLKEWVSLECEGDKPPRIRITRPLTSLRYEGTRKRRRSAMGDYLWSVGDRVDAWLQESWREGLITEKSKKDETTLTVHFPASGETSVVRAWHLRPSLIWKDGKWIESSKVGENGSSTHERVTPNEKRLKRGNHAEDVKGKDNVSKSIDAVDSVPPEDTRSLNLAENEIVFNIGKSSRNEIKQDANRVARTGLQKEGPRVVFGVPKPGKKRKFMEVSKHYDAHGSDKNNDRNDSVKLANFLMPPSSISRGWRNSSKNDTKEKHGADSKPKTSKSGKPQGVLGRAIPTKDISSSNAFSLTNDQTGHSQRVKDSSSHFKNASQSDSQVEKAPYSATDGAAERPILFSSMARSTDAVPTKKTSISRASKGKLAPAGNKLGKPEVEKTSNDNPSKSTSDVVEPRRSNRRIQPTSRLLEGLQSSLIISKIPSGSHSRNTSKGNQG